MMGLRKVFFLFLVILGISNISVEATQKDFKGYSVFSVNIENEFQASLFASLDQILKEPLDYWKGSAHVNVLADVMVSAQDRKVFTDLLQENEVKFKVKVDDVQQLINNERPQVSNRADGFGWEDYYEFEEIMAWLDEQVELYPELTSLTIGETGEGRPMRGVKLSRNEGNPAIFVESNTHAREWITSATATWILNELLTSEDEGVKYMADNYDWYIFPVVNPDGFVYSHASNRLWRKNRTPHGLLCYGTDPNRNWGHMWQGAPIGGHDDICSETYSGQGAFSELETQTVSDFILENADHIKMFLSFHSYSQLMLYPWSYTSEPAEDAELLKEIGDAAAAALERVHGTIYTVQSSFALYEHFGTSVDWTYGVANIRASLTYEFRDTGDYGFVLPADQIIENAEEVLASMVVLVDLAQQNGLFD